MQQIQEMKHQRLVTSSELLSWTLDSHVEDLQLSFLCQAPEETTCADMNLKNVVWRTREFQKGSDGTNIL